MPKLNYRGVAVVVPDGGAIDALIERVDDGGVGRRLMCRVTPDGLDQWRAFILRLYVSGLQDGIDRAIELDADGAPTAVDFGDEPDETPEVLRDLRVETGRYVRSPVQAVVERYRRCELKLPVLPDLTMSLNRMLSSPEHGPSEIVAVVEKDAALADRVMSFACAPRFGCAGREPRSVTDAIVRVGARDLTRYLLAAGNRRLFAFSPRKRAEAQRELWRHSVATAVVAELLADDLPDVHSGSFFLHGLLHDVGRAVLLQIFDDIDAETAGGQRFGADEVLRTVDAIHGQFGTALLQKWGFDDSFVEVSLFHHQPQKSFANAQLVAGIALADLIAVRNGFGAERDTWLGDDLSEHPAACALGVGADAIAFATQMLRRRFDELISIV